jgi:5'-phosphate synthase pdxT subunit
MATIGVLALQGDFAEHKRMLEESGADSVLIKHAGELAFVDGLVIPGGESTTIAKLTGNATDQIFDAIIYCARQGMPIYGTCMGTMEPAWARFFWRRKSKVRRRVGWP